MADQKDPKFPNVPTLKEMKIDWSCGAWRGIAAPKGTPAEIVAILEKTIEKIVKSKDFVDFMTSRGFGIYYLNSKDFAKALEKADKENGEVMKAAGIAK
jgi:tripartite-type tricarboxylate transporter receptor subunit TctC